MVLYIRTELIHLLLLINTLIVYKYKAVQRVKWGLWCIQGSSIHLNFYSLSGLHLVLLLMYWCDTLRTFNDGWFPHALKKVEFQQKKRKEGHDKTQQPQWEFRPSFCWMNARNNVKEYKSYLINYSSAI